MCHMCNTIHLLVKFKQFKTDYINRGVLVTPQLLQYSLEELRAKSTLHTLYGRHHD